MALGLALSLSLYSCKSTDTEVDDSQVDPIKVSISKPVLNENGSLITSSGVVQSVQTAHISTRMMGTITSVNVDIGSHVSKGQVLFTVNSSDIDAKGGQVDANITVAEAALRNAEKDYERFKTLFEKNSATAKELENVTLQYEAAKAQVKAAKEMKNEVNANLQYVRVTAPFSGVITQKMITVGNIASPGMPALVLESSGALEIATTVSESEIVAIKSGMNAEVSISSIQETFTGKVSKTSSSSSMTGGQYIVKISIPAEAQKKVLSGMYANIAFEGTENTRTSSGQTASAVFVSEDAIVHRDELTGLYTVSDNNTALLRWVRLGKSAGGQVEVISGLSSDEAYIVKSDDRLYNGVPVIVQ
ncbi:MAG: efflux RND transporter periplasmic adaptor subunit [Chitinophagales bacterium]|nr:efflux RND transporter periplasmic adaptor subunit [Chitinophagales bacterium]